MQTIATDAPTRWGAIPAIRRDGATIIFEFPDPDQQEQHRARRAAVAWIATNRSDQDGVTAYRFDVRHANGTVQANAF